MPQAAPQGFAQAVDVIVGDVVAFKARDPDHRAGAKIAADAGGQLRLGQAGVAVRVDDRALGGHDGALTIHLQRTAFGDERGGEPRHAQQREYLVGRGPRRAAQTCRCAPAGMPRSCPRGRRRSQPPARPAPRASPSPACPPRWNCAPCTRQVPPTRQPRRPCATTRGARAPPVPPARVHRQTTRSRQLRGRRNRAGPAHASPSPGPTACRRAYAHPQITPAQRIAPMMLPGPARAKQGPGRARPCRRPRSDLGAPASPWPSRRAGPPSWTSASPATRSHNPA